MFYEWGYEGSVNHQQFALLNWLNFCSLVGPEFNGSADAASCSAAILCDFAVCRPGLLVSVNHRCSQFGLSLAICTVFALDQAPRVDRLLRPQLFCRCSRLRARFEAENMPHSAVWNSHPAGYGKGSRKWCALDLRFC